MVDQLKTLVKYGKKVIDRKSPLPILKAVSFSKGEARVTDLETYFSMPITTDFEGVIDFKILEKVLKSKPSAVSIEGSCIAFDGATLKFHPRDIAEFPSLPDQEFRPLGVWDIMRTLSDLTTFCSADELQPSLMGVYLVQNGSFEICATNGHHLKAFTNLPAPAGDFAGIIPQKPLRLLGEEGLPEVAVSDNYLRFTYPDFTVYVRLVDERYLEWETAIPSHNPGKAVFNREDWLPVIDRAAGFTNRTNLGAVDTKTKTLTVENIGDNTSFSADLEVDVVNDVHIRVGFNLNYLSKVLKEQETDQITWEYESPHSASLFNATEQGLTLLMPIRLKD